MSYKEDEYLQLSGIQHFIFCRRQWALVYIELQWMENIRTLEGRFLHEKAHDESSYEKRGDVLITRGMPVFSKEMGVTGCCDIVEFYNSKDGTKLYNRDGLYKPVPVEYKRGEPKKSEEDVMQLAAQAMCLEEMFDCNIDHGYIYYAKTRHRLKVVFENDLKTKVYSIFKEMHELFNRGYTPKVKTGKYCNACSLNKICLPVLCKEKSVQSYIDKYITEDLT